MSGDVGIILDKVLRTIIEAKRRDDEAREKVKNAFIQEFGIEPTIVTPKIAKREILLDENEKVDKILRELGMCREKNEDECYVLVLQVTRGDKKEEDHDWQLVSNVPIVVAKVRDGYCYEIALLTVITARPMKLS